MKILFFMLHPGYVRNYESTLRLLAERGHQIHLAFSHTSKQAKDRFPERLAADHPSISFGVAPKHNDGSWGIIAWAVRGLMDYSRYIHPRYRNAPKLRGRLADKLQVFATNVRFLWLLISLPVRLIDHIHSARLSHVLIRFFSALEQAVPTSHKITRFIADQAPDLVLVTPLVDTASIQVEYIKTAQRLGIRTGLCVASWDNLTNKGLIRLEPDLVILWNEIQRREAVELHGIPPEKIAVTGAQRFDEWFEQRPSTSREEFLQRAGLPPERPYLLYLCSSPFIAPNEVAFVEQWIRQVRSNGTPALRAASILVRPHPQNAEQWRDVDFSMFENVTIWPRHGANPVTTSSRADFYDSLYYSAAVMGINTSAQIEASIVGRPVFTLLAPEFAGTQEGTLHFHYLLHENGGPLHIARSYPEHLRQLAAALDDAVDDRTHRRRFVESFIRPHGLDVACTPLVAEAIEQLGRLPRPRPIHAPFWAYGLRFLLLPLAYATNYLRRPAMKQGSKRRKAGTRTTARTRLQALPRRVASRGMRFLLARRPVRVFGRRVIVPLLPAAGLVPSSQAETALPGAVEIAAAKGMLAKIARGDRMVVVGPWLSEIGFELLYWIPFLNWVQTSRPIDPARLVIVSRGGAWPWYRGLSDRYFDILDWYTPDEFRLRNEERVAALGRGLKHWSISDFDRGIIERTKQALGVSEVDLLHPSAMYHLYSPYWRKRATIRQLEKHSRYQVFPALDPGGIGKELPDEYIAVKFYFSNAFPDTPANREFIAQLLAELSARIDIVLLSTGLHLDDHWDYTATAAGRIHTIEDRIVPSRNLEIQTRVIAGARAFVGTYGGFSYLAPFYGVDSIAIYSDPESFLPHHVDIARRAFTGTGTGAFLCLDRRDIEVLRLVLSGVVAAPLGSR